MQSSVNIPVDSELTNAWRLVGTMSKISDLAIEQEIQFGNMLHYADNCILIEKIMLAYPNLLKSKTLAISLVDRVSIKEATTKAQTLLFKELAELIKPRSSGPCFEAYLNLKLTNPNLITAKEALLKEHERQEYEAGQGP